MYSIMHFYASVHGTQAIGTAVDEWQFGIRMPALISPNTDELQAIANGVRDETVTLWGDIKGSFATTTKLTHVRLAQIGTDGLLVDPERVAIADVATASQAGTSAAGMLPPQVAVACSLLTDSSRGYAHRGRIYLPTPAASTLQNDGSLQNTARDEFVGGVRNWIERLNTRHAAAGAQVGDVHVMSRVLNGAHKKVTSVAVGNRFDVQRRRAEKMPEAYGTSVAIP